MLVPGWNKNDTPECDAENEVLHFTKRILVVKMNFTLGQPTETPTVINTCS